MILCALLGCAHGQPIAAQELVAIPAGTFWMGSDLQERAEALHFARQSPATAAGIVAALRHEIPRQPIETLAFRIMERPVTQREYWQYTREAGAPEPWLDAASWDAQRTGYTYAVVERFGWTRGRPDPDRLEHPIVLVSFDEARAYCDWWGEQHGARGDLPSEVQWEKAARGAEGLRYPWGDAFGADGARRANTLESGRQDTFPVGSIPESASPYGVHDMAGNVFEWTRTADGSTAFIVKGGAWNSHAWAARAAARHARPASTRHVAIGFRCVLHG